MKRMVKNGNLLDVKPNGDLGIKGNAQVGGRLQVNSSIISTGEIRGGDVSASKFYLGTEEMPLVKANPTGEAMQTLEKIKIGNVAYKVGGGSENDKVLTLTMPYPRNLTTTDMFVRIDNETWNKINNCEYEAIKIYYNDGYPLGNFNLLYYYWQGSYGEGYIKSKEYASIANRDGSSSVDTWYGSSYSNTRFAKIETKSDSEGKYIRIWGYSAGSSANLSKDKFDALYKLADKPTQDGNYILKASVSGGVVAYTWELQQ